MQLFPDYSFGLLNIWWYPLIYGVVTILVMSIISKSKKKRILTFPKSISAFISFILGKGLIIYSFFIPLRPSAHFYIGTIIYLIGLISSVYAMWTFSKADLSEPVTHGIYKISRHPMQVMSFVMWIGIGLASGTWIVIICTLLFIVVSHPSLKAQEQYCLDTYGDSYHKYMEITRRYLGKK